MLSLYTLSLLFSLLIYELVGIFNGNYYLKLTNN